MHWVEANRHWFEKYVREVANQMGLRDWTLSIDDEPPEDDDAGAFNHVVYGRKVAQLRFSTPESPEELRHWVTHELLHCHAALLGWNAQSIQPALSVQAYQIWHGGFHDAVELMIDGIAMAWSEMLPLPLHEIEVNNGSNHRRDVETDQQGPVDVEPVVAESEPEGIAVDAHHRWEPQPDGTIAHIVDTPKGPMWIGYHYPCVMPPASNSRKHEKNQADGKRGDWTPWIREE